jgi:NADH:ubiquinone oxidoreductase subunit 3 (subunit A)
MNVTRVAWILVSLGAIALLLAMQELLRPPEVNQFWNAFFDAGHVPLSGVLSLALLRLSLTLLPQLRSHRFLHYVLAFAVAMSIGVVVEAVQFVGPRDAELADIVRNACGSAAMLLAACALDPVLGLRRRTRALALALAFVVFFAPCAPVVSIALAYRARDAAFPRLSDFESGWEPRFVHAHHAQLERTSPPPGWTRPPGTRVGHVTFLRARYPGLALVEPVPDWSAYDRLAFEAYSRLETRVQLVVRIHDVRHDNRYGDRFNRTITIDPGANRIVIPLADVRAAPEGREMDLTRIRQLAVFAVRPPEPFSLYFDSFRLESD